MTTDSKMLRALLADERPPGGFPCPGLSDQEREAFTDMLATLDSGDRVKLTTKQREWVEKRYKQLELDADDGAANVWSAGEVPRGIPEPPRDYERMPRPLAPPGRRT